MRRTIFITMIALIAFIQANVSFAADIPEVKANPNKVNIPPSVLNIAKENTYPNPTQELPMLQPSNLAEQLIESSDIKIENPELIQMLNESAIAKAPLAFGYRATIYLGHWALNYESSETAPNWEYQKINTNYYDNRGGEVPYKLRYVQESQ